MNLSDFAIKAYSIGINIKLLNFLNSIRAIKVNGGTVTVKTSPELKFEFDINTSELGSKECLINQLIDAIQILNAKYGFVSEFKNTSSAIIFVFSSGASPEEFQDQLPLISDFIVSVNSESNHSK